MCEPTSGDMRGESLPGMPEGASESQSLGECQRTKSARQPPGLAALKAAMSDARTSPCSRIRALWPASESPACHPSLKNLKKLMYSSLFGKQVKGRWGIEPHQSFFPLQAGALLMTGDQSSNPKLKPNSKDVCIDHLPAKSASLSEPWKTVCDSFYWVIGDMSPKYTRRRVNGNLHEGLNCIMCASWSGL